MFFSCTSLAIPKSVTLHVRSSPTRMFLAARSRWIICSCVHVKKEGFGLLFDGCCGTCISKGLRVQIDKTRTPSPHGTSRMESFCTLFYIYFSGSLACDQHSWYWINWFYVDRKAFCISKIDKHSNFVITFISYHL